VLCGIWFQAHLERESMAKTTKTQIAAEIRAILDLIEINRYLPRLAADLEEMRAGRKVPTFWFSSSQSFTAVYEANLQHLGYLDGATSEAVRFYMVLRAAVEDKDLIRTFAAMMKDSREAGKAVDPAIIERTKSLHESLYAKLSHAVSLGEKIWKELGHEKAKLT
jgi:hypothetical protein